MKPTSTLLVRHLPPDLTSDEKEELLKHFGAVQVKILSSKIKKSNILFARFESEAAATAALHRLHQLDILGYPLSVEYARGVAEHDYSLVQKLDFHERTEEKENSQKHLQAFLQKLNAWNSTWNFTNPPPSHLKYQYPPPTMTVLHNISCTLASVPKFYTQVLHLMNKMNLPCPFQPIPFPKSEMLSSSVHADMVEESDNVPPEPIQTVESSEEEESELESDEERQHLPTDIIPAKRPLLHKPKQVKRPKFIKPVHVATTPAVKISKPEEVFEKVVCEPIQHKIEVKFSIAVGDVEKVNEQGSCSSGGFGLMFPVTKNADKAKSDENIGITEEEASRGTTITAEELEANRISSRDQKHHPVFRNYQPGIPSCRLYIKNLSKQVTERDLHYIYRRYLIPNNDEQGNMFDVRLMTEGRMKGQAFITLQSMKQAEAARKETNGYILKNKPLVVQFARSAKTK
ncbi:RNA-binding protein 40-like isoform X2 [Zootermopsis nevadensis]|uniref:RNA-binding region-containing protein 3 n=1 Tax=Zootermopsis nevadensis TaxID=136037 RepID=A0A067RCF2_ZOONE|nr:RNA-binding protein 40-like isoform X2 [Zootermopsis nevadensis]KDR17564.1 RNA-binding protein 40 [Zootermopsis nevadensis]